MANPCRSVYIAYKMASEGVWNTPSDAILWGIYTDPHRFAAGGTELESGQLKGWNVKLILTYNCILGSYLLIIDMCWSQILAQKKNNSNNYIFIKKTFMFIGNWRFRNGDKTIEDRCYGTVLWYASVSTDFKHTIKHTFDCLFHGEIVHKTGKAYL